MTTTILNIDDDSGFANAKPYFRVRGGAIVTMKDLTYSIDSSLGQITSQPLFEVDENAILTLGNVKI